MKAWTKWRWWLDYASIITGAALCGVAIATLLEPNQVVPGGITGLAMILKDQLGLPYGLVLIGLNLPLLWAAWRCLGGPSALIRTVIGVLVMAASIEVASKSLGVLTEDRLLVIFYGGLLSGVGLALVFHGRGTTGGTDILSRLIHLWFDTGVGKAMLGVNVIVFGLAGVIYGVEPAAVALLVSFVMTKSLDSVLHGLVASRSALVVTSRALAVKRAVNKELRRGATLLQGQGDYSREDYAVLYVVVSRAEVARLKRCVAKADPDAFLTLYSPQEVIGTGYGQRTTSVLGDIPVV